MWARMNDGGERVFTAQLEGSAQSQSQYRRLGTTDTPQYRDRNRLLQEYFRDS